jgi:hypothetical protein
MDSTGAAAKYLLYVLVACLAATCNWLPAAGLAIALALIHAQEALEPRD